MYKLLEMATSHTTNFEGNFLVKEGFFTGKMYF